MAKKISTEMDWLVFIAVILVVLWFLGMVFAAAFGGGLINLLLVIALIVIVVRVSRGQSI